MRKIVKLMSVVITLLIFIPFTQVNASSKTEDIIKMLEQDVKSFDGKLTYESNNIQIDWVYPNSNLTEVSFPYKGSVIEYNSGEIKTYEEAEKVTSHSIFFMYLIEATLKVNGYSDEQIESFFSSDESDFSYEKNGMEIKNIGEEKKFTSIDGLSTITVAPIQIRIDVAKANIGTSDTSTGAKTTTVSDVINYLQSDSEFTTTMYEGKKIYENEIIDNEDSLIIYHTYYWDDYYSLNFNCEDDIITYEDTAIETYGDAEIAQSHHFFAQQIISSALKLNGYTTEEINEYLSSSENSFDYEKNGIELKILGENKEYTSSDGRSKLYVFPISFKIDLNKANIDKNDSKTIYKVLEGDNQTVGIGKKLSFRFNIEFLKFKEVGKVYIDGELVDPSKYVLKEGSTIITFNDEFVKTLSAKEHTVKVVVDDGEVETKFTLINNPQTGDNIMFYVSMFVLSVIGLVSTGLYTSKKVNE